MHEDERDRHPGSDPDGTPPPDRDAQSEPAEASPAPAAGSGAPAAAEAWPTAPSADTTETSEWPAQRAEPPMSQVEAYPSSERRDAPSVGEGGSGESAHAVPASVEAAGSESTQCPRCGTENRPGLSFCRNCGQRLLTPGMSSTLERPGTPDGTMACPRCGTHNRAGVAFCQNCGANLRGVGGTYVAPVRPGEETLGRRGAILGPIVLLVGLAGLITGYLLPFAYGSGSLWQRASGPDGYGVAFWAGYPEVGAALADQAYFGLAAPIPILGVLLVALAVAGFVRAAPGPIQTVGLAVALAWSVALVVLFVIAELLANWGDLVGLLRALSPGGIIFFLSALIVVIGTLTRFGRS